MTVVERALFDVRRDLDQLVERRLELLDYRSYPCQPRPHGYERG